MLIKPTRVEQIDANEIYIYDGLFDEPDIKRYCATLRHANFTFLHASRNDTVQYREWAASFAVDDFKNHSLYEYALQAASVLSDGRDLKCYDVFCSASSFGDMSFIHNDSTKSSDVSVLYYGNNVWEPDWGGETVFYKDDLDARLAIGVVPGRLIAFRGGLKHRAGVPTKVCSEVRLSLSIRFELIVPD